MNALRTLVPLSLLFILCDLPWLYTVASWSQTMVQKIQRGSPMVLRWQAAPVVYVALAYLVLQATSTLNAFLIGLSTYAVYDFTNYATLDKYDGYFAIADTLWGGILFTIVRTLAIYLNIM